MLVGNKFTCNSSNFWVITSFCNKILKNFKKLLSLISLIQRNVMTECFRNLMSLAVENHQKLLQIFYEPLTYSANWWLEQSLQQNQCFATFYLLDLFNKLLFLNFHEAKLFYYHFSLCYAQWFLRSFLFCFVVFDVIWNMPLNMREKQQLQYLFCYILICPLFTVCFQSNGIRSN